MPDRFRPSRTTPRPVGRARVTAHVGIALSEWGASSPGHRSPVGAGNRHSSPELKPRTPDRGRGLTIPLGKLLGEVKPLPVGCLRRLAPARPAGGSNASVIVEQRWLPTRA